MVTPLITKTTVNDLKLTQNVITDISIDIPEINVDFGADLLKFLGTISFIKPNSLYNIYLNIRIYSDMECTELLGEISSKNNDDKKYFQVFFSNNNTSKWIYADDKTLTNGFGSEFDKHPVVFNIGKWFKEIAKITTFDANTKYYILYTWSNGDNESFNKSDINSVIWPNFENY